MQKSPIYQKISLLKESMKSSKKSKIKRDQYRLNNLINQSKINEQVPVKNNN
jgi:hypothetical protein